MELLLKYANDDFKRGDYKLALDKYIKLKHSRYLANILSIIMQFNITYSEQKLYDVVDVNNIPVQNIIKWLDK